MAEADMARTHSIWAAMRSNPYHHMALGENQMHSMPMMVEAVPLPLYPAPQANPNAVRIAVTTRDHAHSFI